MASFNSGRSVTPLLSVAALYNK
jgi:hypothetical protein